MNDVDWTGVIFGMGVLVLGTIILVVLVVTAEKFYRARSQRHDMVRLESEVAYVRERLDSIESLLRTVE